MLFKTAHTLDIDLDKELFIIITGVFMTTRYSLAICGMLYSASAFRAMRTFCAVVVCALTISTAHAGNDVVRTDLNKALRLPGNAGKEFYLTFLPCYEEAGNNKLMLYIAASAEGVATIDVEGKSVTVTRQLKPNDIVSVELSPGVGQVFSKSVSSGIPAEQVYPKAAVHVTATVPVIVYAVTRFSYTSDSYLALPVHALGKEYIVASMADMSWMYGGLSLPSEAAIVATSDETTVEYTLGGSMTTTSGGGKRTGETITFVMNRGDVWVIGNNADSKEGDMTGSVVRSTKPVAVVSGNQCANVPTTIRWCDFVSEMEMPSSSWGKELQLPRYASRKNGYFMKVFAKEPNTRVSYNGSYWKTLMTAGGVEGRGWIYQRVDGTGNNIVSLSADKPVSATLFNPGQEDDNVSTDPFQMNVLPVEQYQRYFTFATPGSRGGISFTRNYLGVVFPLDSATQTIPPDLEFGTSTNGEMVWKSFSATFGPGIATKDVFPRLVKGKRYAFKECTLPGDNVYAVRYKDPIMCYSYGGSDYDSYGHPAGGGFYTVGSDTVPTAPMFTVSADGSVKDGRAEDGPLNPAIRSNLASIIINPLTSSNYVLEYDAFVPGDDSATTWRLRVIDGTKDAHAEVIFSDKAGNSSVATVDHKGTIANVHNGENSMLNDDILSITPNPMINGTAVISTQLHHQSEVRMDVVTVQGQVVATIVNATRPQGTYSDTFVAGNMPAGSYLLRMQCNGRTIVRTMQVGGR